MADVYRVPRWNGVRETIRDPLQSLVQQLQMHLGENLLGVTVVGSALTDDFRPGASDINTVALLERHDSASLNAVASIMRPLSRRDLSPPLLVTPWYIERSRDVFGVEFLDFQLTHQTILGEDPFDAIRIEKTDVRLQCERELKATQVRLRQGYIAAAGDKGLLHDLLISTGKNLAPVARAMLWLNDLERPRTMDAALQKAGTQFKVDLNAAVAAEQWRYTNQRLSQAEMEDTFAGILDAVDQLATIIDEMKL